MPGPSKAICLEFTAGRVRERCAVEGAPQKNRNGSQVTLQTVLMIVENMKC